MNRDHPNRRIGYNPKLFINQEVARKYLCTICSKVLKDPVQIPQTADPKRACKDCYKENIRWYCTVLFSLTNLPSSNICNTLLLQDFSTDSSLLLLLWKLCYHLFKVNNGKTRTKCETSSNSRHQSKVNIVVLVSL